MRTRREPHGFFLFLCLVPLLLPVSAATAADVATGKSAAPAEARQAKPATVAPTPAMAVQKAEAEKAEDKYLRLRRDQRGRPTAMEIAIVRFQPTAKGKQGQVVDLIGAVHVAEPSFFTKLNQEFGKYDAVLYELVADEGTRPVQGQKTSGGNPVSALQTGLTRLLNLQFQLDGIDYQRENMVHADMSPEEFSKSMRDRGESFFALFLRMIGYAMMQQSSESGGTNDMELLMALMNNNRSLALKRIMAKQFEDLGGVMIAIDGPDGSTLISERNKKALSVLRQELASGKEKLAIFYGAGHMPDMAKRLKKDFGLEPTGTRWLLAWDMADPKSKKKPSSH